MPRHARFRVEGLPLHVIQRGNNRGPCFFAAEDRLSYLSLLQELAEAHGCGIHAYVLMTNHVHLLMTPERAEGASQLMKNLGQRYVQLVNRKHARTGSLWEGRFRSSIVDSERYLLTCHRYIECNPVRAGITPHPADYRWSSFRANALGVPSKILTGHPIYLALGADDESRRAAYADLFKQALSESELEEIRRSANGGFALGSDHFIDQLAERLGVSPTRSKKRGQTTSSAFELAKAD